MSDLHEAAHGVSKHVTLGFLGWIFGTIMGIAGIIMLCQSGYRTSGEFFILAALAALPPVQTQLKKKAHISLAGSLRVVLIIIFFIVAAATLPPESGNAAPAKAPSNAPIADNTDITTQDIYTTVAGQTVYPLKNKYTGDFYITLDGEPQATGDDGKDDPKQYQALYNDTVPFIRFTSDPGGGHALRMYEHPAQFIESYDLVNAYKENQITADAKYKDQTIDVAGTIFVIGKNSMGILYIALDSEDPSATDEMVQCFFDQSDESQLTKVKRGYTVTLQGTVEGLSTSAFNILLGNCGVINVIPTH